MVEWNGAAETCQRRLLRALDSLRGSVLLDQGPFSEDHLFWMTVRFLHPIACQPFNFPTMLGFPNAFLIPACGSHGFCGCSCRVRYH
jgi:hypothetical protein